MFKVCYYLFHASQLIGNSMVAPAMSTASDFLANLQTLESQFLCCYNVNHIDWEKILHEISWDEQQLLLQRTVCHPLNKSHPIKRSYQQSFLKKVISFLESSNSEVHDEIYEAFCELQLTSLDEEQFSFKHYSLPEFSSVFTLKESKSFVAGGTTGLCSWQASIALSQWLLSHSEHFKEKSLLELGSGTGLCGFVASKCCAAENVIMTDGSLKVIQLLNENLERNFQFANEVLSDEDSSLSVLEYDGRRIGSLLLPWEEVDELDLSRIPKPDVLLAADVVYDNSVFPALCKAMDALFRWTENRCSMILAATVRNLDTLNEFLQLLEKFGFSVKKEEEGEGKKFLFWDKSTLVNIYTITRLS